MDIYDTLRLQYKADISINLVWLPLLSQLRALKPRRSTTAFGRLKFASQRLKLAWIADVWQKNNIDWRAGLMPLRSQ
jgi:hypothetical protein